jgi:broad specificity phosphatase PhoE
VKSNTTVIVVRHAEKASSDRDPALSDVGRARARDLAHVLGQTPIDAIFTTQYVRTRETARPLADLRKLEAIAIDATATHIAELAQRIRTRHRNQTVVVVGHSNTVPAILAALGADDPPAIGDDDYDHLYILNIREDDSAHLVSLRYGAD